MLAPRFEGVFVVTHRSAPVTSAMNLQDFQEGLLSIEHQFPLTDRFVHMRMMARLTWKLQDRLMGLLISNLGALFSDEFLASPAWTRQSRSLAQVARINVERVRAWRSAA